MPEAKYADTIAPDDRVEFAGVEYVVESTELSDNGLVDITLVPPPDSVFQYRVLVLFPPGIAINTL